ncbi:hypothetical protein [uncultured Nostoc sp.]|uniref:hypothetical protein n=1 Tax=uncultured Nostoc sp. TaxID=340711 RepID=UPI0035CC7059
MTRDISENLPPLHYYRTHTEDKAKFTGFLVLTEPYWATMYLTFCPARNSQQVMLAVDLIENANSDVLP